MRDRKEYARKWREANRERIAAQKRACYLQNKVRINARNTAYYVANRRRILNLQSDYRKENAQRISERMKAYHERIRERKAAKDALWRQVNREKLRLKRAAERPIARVREKNWRVRNALKIRSKSQKRRAKLYGTSAGVVSLHVLYVRDQGFCGLCGLLVAPAESSIDHKIPLIYGGVHNYANTQLAHLRCNSRQGGRIAHERRQAAKTGYVHKELLPHMVKAPADLIVDPKAESAQEEESVRGSSGNLPR